MKKKIVISSILIILIILVIGILTIFYLNNKKKDYEVEEISDYKYFTLKQNDKYGVIDSEGNTIVEPSYNSVKIPNPSKDVFICYEGDKSNVLNSKGEEINTKFQNIEPLTLKNVSTDLIYEKSILKYEEKGKYGIITLDGKKITNAIYDSIETLQYKEGELLVKKGEKYGVINMNGYTIVEPEYDKIEADGYYSKENGYKCDGYIVSNTTDEGYRYGYINSNGQKLLDVKYNDLKRMNFENSDMVYIIAAENGKYGLIENSKIVIPNEYQEITYIEEKNVCILKKGKKYGLANLNGSILLQVQYAQIDISGDYVYVTDNEDNRTVYDIKGNKTDIDPNTVILTVGNNKEYQIKMQTLNGKTSYDIYKNDEKITKESYNYIEYLFKNYFIVSKSNGKLGIIDDKDNVKVEMKYDTIQKMQNEHLLQALQSNSKTIDIYSEDMVNLVQMKNAVVNEYNDYTEIKNDTDVKYINNEGKVVSNTDIFKNNTLFAKYQNGKWGFVDKEGNMIVDYQFDKVTEINNYGFAGVMKNGKWGVMNKNGNIIVEPTYELSDDSPEFIGQYYKVIYGFGEFYYTK